MPVLQKIGYLISIDTEFQFILQMIARITRIALQKSFETDFLTIIDNAKFRPSFVIC